MSFGITSDQLYSITGGDKVTIKVELLEGDDLLMEDQPKMAGMEDLIVVYQVVLMEDLHNSRVHTQLPTWDIKVEGVASMEALLGEGRMLLVHMVAEEVPQLVVVEDSNSGMYFGLCEVLVTLGAVDATCSHYFI